MSEPQDEIEAIFHEVVLMTANHNPDPEPDPFKSEEYQKFVESMVPLCCCKESNRPCDGVLAGGLCDGIVDDPWNDQESFSP